MSIELWDEGGDLGRQLVLFETNQELNGQIVASFRPARLAGTQVQPGATK